MNKLIPVISLLAVLMATAIFLTQSDDSEALTDGYWTFNVDGENKATITAYTNTGTNPETITIPATVTSGGVTYPVIAVGDGTNAIITGNIVQPYSLVFSEGIVSINAYACHTLPGFTGTLTLPSTLESIGNFAFDYNDFTGELIIPDSVTSIGEYAFYHCQGTITKLKLPNGIDTIYNRSFGAMLHTYCDLIIPEGVSVIEQYAFSNSSFGYASAVDGGTVLVLPSTVTTIGTSAFHNMSVGLATLYNLSALPITAGSSDYGEIAKNVTTVTSTLPTAPSITSSPTETIQIGDDWSYTVTYSGDRTQLLSATYPSWITQSGDTFTGTNAPGGNYPIEITVEDRFYRTATQTFTVIVTSDYVISIESSNTAYGTVDQSILIVPYGTSYSVSGDTLTVGSTDVTATPTPTVEGDQYLYSFSGWNVSSGTVTSNMSIVANFVQMVREYTVTINVNNPSYGTVNKNSVTVPYGSTMVVSGLGLYIGNTIVTPTPTPATIDTNYWFGNWTFPPGNPSGSTITHDITVTANFYSGVRYYEITFVTLPDGYGTLDIDYPYSTSNGYRASYGSAISVSGNVLTVDGERDFTVTALSGAQEVDWTYSFDNWTVSSSTVTGDMTINANFTRTANTVVEVTVTTTQGQFYEGDNAYTSHVFRVPIPSTVSQDRETGTLYLWNYEITVDMTALTEQYEYNFSIWDGVPTGGQITDGMTFNAVFTSEDRYYTVTFHIADGFGTLTPERVLVLYNTLIYSENNVIVVGSNTITATPTPDGDGATYEFIRWDGLPMSGRILEDTDISAKIQRTVTANAFNIVEIEHGEVERVWSIPDEYLPLMLVIPIMLLIGMVLLSLNRKSDDEDYDNY